MEKQVLKICFLVFFLLSKGNQTISESPESDESTPEYVEEPDFFSSLPAVAETLRYGFTLPETKDVSFEPEVDGYMAQVKAAAPEPAPSKEMILPEMDESSADDDDYNSPIETSVPASSVAIPFSELDTDPAVMSLVEEVGASPAPNRSILASMEEDADALTLESDQNNDYNSSTENPESETSENSSTSPEEDTESMKVALVEEVGASPAPYPSTSMEEDADDLTLESDQNNDYNYSTENTESVTSEDSRTSAEEDTESMKVASPVAAVVDEEVDIPPISYDPFTYRAEDETFDIVYEENEGSWGSWDGGQISRVKVAGVVVGVCLVGLAGLVYSTKNKKKTEIHYQSLSKGI